MTVELSSGTAKPILPLNAKTLLFALIGVLYVYTLATNETFLFNKSDPEWAHIAPFKMWLLPHGMAAAFALFLGPFQFSERLRRQYLMVHKTFGYLLHHRLLHRRPAGHLYRMVRGTAGRNAQLHHRRRGRCRRVDVRHRHGAGDDPESADATTPAMDDPQLFLRPDLPGGAGHPGLLQGSGEQSETVVWCCVVAAYPIADLVLQVDELRRQRARPARA